MKSVTRAEEGKQVRFVGPRARRRRESMPKLSSFVKGGKGGDPPAAKGRRRDAPRSEKTQPQEEGRQGE